MNGAVPLWEVLAVGCCLAVAFVIALVRRAWYALVPGGPPAPVLFAPPARRRADGTTPTRARVVVPEPAAASRVAIGLGAAAVATAFYAGVVAVLRWTGLAESMPGAIDWVARDVLVAAIGTVLVVVAALLYRGGRPRGGRAPVLLGGGAAFFGLGVLDMHVFGLLHLGHSVSADVLFHGPGLVAMTLGVGSYAAELRERTAAELAGALR